MSLNWAYLTPIIILLFIPIYLGLWGRKYVSDVDSYYVMNREANIWLALGTYAASWMTTATYFGALGVAHLQGYGPALLAYGFLGVVIFAFFIGTQLRRYGAEIKADTMPDYFSYRFQSSGLKALTGAVIAGGMIIYAVAQFIAMGVLMEMGGIPFLPGMIIVAVVMIFLMILGGTRSVVVNDLINLIAMFLAVVIVAPIVLYMAGGIDSVVSGAGTLRAATFWNWAGTRGTWGAISYHVSWTVAIAASPHLVSRAFVAKDDRTLVLSAIGANILVFIMVSLFYFGVGIGSIMLLQQTPPNQDAVFPAVNTAIPAVLGGMMVALVLSAGWSTANTQITLAAFSLTKDLWVPYVNPKADEKRVIGITQWFIIIATALAIIFAVFRFSFVFMIATLAAGYYGAVLTPLMLYGIWWRRTTRTAAFWGTVLTSIVYAVFGLVPSLMPAGMMPVIPATIFNLIFIPVVSLLTRQSTEEMEALEKLHAVDEQYRAARKPARSFGSYLPGTVMLVGIIIWGIILSAWMTL